MRCDEDGMADDIIGAGENLFGRQRRSRQGHQNLDLSTQTTYKPRHPRAADGRDRT